MTTIKINIQVKVHYYPKTDTVIVWKHTYQDNQLVKRQFLARDGKWIDWSNDKLDECFIEVHTG